MKNKNAINHRMRVYAPDDFYKFSTYKIDKKLSYETIKNGVVHSAINWTSFFQKFKDTGFITDENNQWVLSSASYEKALYSRIPNENNEFIAKTIHKKAIFLGAFRQHYGHFICQGLTRLWFLLNHKYDDYDLVYIPQGVLPDFVFKYLDLFGIDKKQLTPITETTMYDEIIVPEISFALDRFWTKEFKDTINRIKKSISPVKNKRVYLSRLHFDDNLIGEKYIEKIFELNGYKIIYPEEMSIEEQISVISGANDVVGVVGTALHNLMFMQDGAKCTILERNNIPNYNQIVINDMRSLNTDYVYANNSSLPSLSGKGPYVLLITKYLQKYFDKKRIVYKEKNLKNNANLQQTYLLAWYLMYSDEALLDKLLKSHNNKQKDIKDYMYSLEKLYKNVEISVVSDKILDVFKSYTVVSCCEDDKMVINTNKFIDNVNQKK